MKVTQTNLRDFLGASGTCFAIPVYQRVYAWTHRQLDDWWVDMQQAGQSGKDHFIGMLYCKVENRGDVRQLNIIDGQQRLSTTSIMLAALRDHLATCDVEKNRISPDEIDQRYLRLPGADAPATKLAMSRADTPTMNHMVVGSPAPDEEDGSRYMTEAYDYFRARMHEEGFDPDMLMRGLEHMSVVMVQLEEDDRPQDIFESLNAKGMSLTTLDLMRNLLLMGFSDEERRRLNREYWRPIEELYASDHDSRYLMGAIRWWLGARHPEDGFDDAEAYGILKSKMADADAREKEMTMKSLLERCAWFRKRLDSKYGDELRRLCDDWATDRPQIGFGRKAFGD